MPFGLKCAGNTFVRAVQMILRPIRTSSDAYIDDMSVLSNQFREHLTHLRSFLSLIRSSGLTLNLKKCQFAKREVTYVGHIVGGGTHRPDPTKLEAISRLKVPGNKKQLRQALGALGFYRAYIPNYAEIAANLTRLVGTKSPNRLIWTDETVCI